MPQVNKKKQAYLFYVFFIVFAVCSMRKETFASSCAHLTPRKCSNFSTFKHISQDGCLWQSKYGHECIHFFCATACASTPCPTGQKLRLCEAYCTNVRLKSSRAQSALHRCLAANDLSKVETLSLSMHRAMQALKDICEQRDMSYDVSALHLGTVGGMVYIHAFLEHIAKAMRHTYKMGALINKISKLNKNDPIRQKAYEMMRESDKHAQYFTIVAHNTAKSCKVLREQIQNLTFSQGASEDENIDIKLDQIERPHQHFFDLIQMRARAFMMHSIDQGYGGRVRLSDFEESIRKAINLTSRINHLYILMQRRGLIDSDIKDAFYLSNQDVIKHCSHAETLNRKSKALLRVIMKNHAQN